MEFSRDFYLQQLIQKKHNGAIKVITGIRRCGKSYLLFELFKKHLLEEGIPADHIIEIALDDIRFSHLRNPLNLNDYIQKKTIDNSFYYVLIDEIQYCKSIANPTVEGDMISFYEVLNSLLRQKNIDTYVTGSNSRMLSSDVLTEFRGRGDELRLHPLSFQEYYSSKEEPFDSLLTEYLRYGGLPHLCELESNTEKEAYLTNLLQEVYLKDILEHNRIHNESGRMEILLNILSSSIGSFTNASKISRTFQSELHAPYDPKTILNHLKYLEEAFLIEEAKRFDVKGRKYIGANSKYYFSDLGLRNAQINYRQLEPTHLMENLIYNELRTRNYTVDVGIVEYHTKDSNGTSKRVPLEVDFVAAKNNQQYYIQSAYRIETEEKREQETRSLLHIDDSFKKVIITRDETKPWYDDQGLLTISLKDFLLDETALKY